MPAALGAPERQDTRSRGDVDSREIMRDGKTTELTKSAKRQPSVVGRKDRMLNASFPSHHGRLVGRRRRILYNVVWLFDDHIHDRAAVRTGGRVVAWRSPSRPRLSAQSGGGKTNVPRIARAAPRSNVCYVVPKMNTHTSRPYNT